MRNSLFLLLVALVSCSADQSANQARSTLIKRSATVSTQSGTKDSRSPKRIRIVPDDHHAVWVGRTDDETLFFVTTPFVPAIDDDGREFAAVFFWNSDGSFREARLHDLGIRDDLPDGAVGTLVEELVSSLSGARRSAIDVEPFQVEKWGTTFGLIYTEFEGDEWVELLPGNFMAFTPPWNGYYDT